MPDMLYKPLNYFLASPPLMLISNVESKFEDPPQLTSEVPSRFPEPTQSHFMVTTCNTLHNSIILLLQITQSNLNHSDKESPGCQ